MNRRLKLQRLSNCQLGNTWQQVNTLHAALLESMVWCRRVTLQGCDGGGYCQAAASTAAGRWRRT